jgi:hypothetical protein
MLLPLLLQLAAGSAPGPDSVYSTPALRALVASAAEVNRVVPAGLRSYRSRLDSEMAFLLRAPDGSEAASQMEQTENELHWWRNGEFEQRVIGYRSQAIGLAPSGLSYMRQAWAVPVLYGNRMSLFFGRDTTRTTRARRSPRPGRAPTPLYAIHPLASDRGAVYHFSGGDTVATVLADGRRIPIVRIDVDPDIKTPRPTLVFRGEVDLDAVRHQIVRMRGHFLTVGRKTGTAAKLFTVAVQAVAYVELVNGEVSSAAGRFWLPTYQRIEFQAAVPMLGDGRSIFRIISRIRDYAINEDTSAAVTLAGGDSAIADSLIARPHRLTFAPRDSIASFSSWDRELGTLAGGVHADDFVDVAPDAWRPDGPPRLEVRGERFGDFFRFNRIEGPYTGLGVTLRLRDAAPGLTARANAGWAWSEETVRGGLSGEWLRGKWLHGARMERALAHTNDFRLPLESSATFAAILGGQDDFDYVDRWTTSVSTARELGANRGWVLRVEAGAGSDRSVVPHAERGLFKLDSGFRANRGIDEGRYVRSAFAATYHPDVTGLFIQPGVGALLSYERGDGELDWQRVEARVVARHIVGHWTYSGRLDGGILFADNPPPQQLVELGSTQGLPGYDYKEFAGDRAALARSMVMYNLPWRGSPIRIWRRFYLPSPSPALSAGVQSGWTEASSAAALASIRRLHSRANPPKPLGVPYASPTDGVRTTVDLTLRFFGGAAGLGVARPVDRHEKWRFVFQLGQEI